MALGFGGLPELLGLCKNMIFSIQRRRVAKNFVTSICPVAQRRFYSLFYLRLRVFALKNYLLLLVYFLSIMNIQPQSIIENDTLLKAFRNKINKSWNLEISKDRLTVISKKKVWILNENKINAPVSFAKNKEDERIKKNGKNIYMKLFLRLEPLWSKEKYKEAKEKNDLIHREIEELPQKYNIENLKDELLSSKNAPIYVGNTKEEMRQVELYAEEKNTIEKTILKYPDFTSEKYSIFIESKEGFEDEFHSVYPAEVGKEFYSLIEEMRKSLPLP